MILPTYDFTEDYSQPQSFLLVASATEPAFAVCSMAPTLSARPASSSKHIKRASSHLKLRMASPPRQTSLCTSNGGMTRSLTKLYSVMLSIKKRHHNGVLSGTACSAPGWCDLFDARCRKFAKFNHPHACDSLCTLALQPKGLGCIDTHARVLALRAMQSFGTVLRCLTPLADSDSDLSHLY